VRIAHQCGYLFLMVIGQKAMISQKNWFHGLLRCGGAQCAPYGANVHFATINHSVRDACDQLLYFEECPVLLASAMVTGNSTIY
jgi:hypothetical protein